MSSTCNHAPLKPSGTGRSDNTPTAPWVITCGTNLCASKRAPATAANSVPLSARRESWLTSVTKTVSSPVSLASVLEANCLIVTGSFITTHFTWITVGAATECRPYSHSNSTQVLRVRACRLHHDRRDVLIADQLIKGRHVGSH